MKALPKFWTTVDQEARAADGRRLALRMWGWSTSSLAEAAEVAADRLSQAAAKLAAGGELESWKYYPRLPLREETLGEVASGEQLLAVVTRNRYGAEVLNTDLFLIADIDLPEEPQDSSPREAGTKGGGGWLSRLRGRRSDPPPEPETAAGPAPDQESPAAHEALGRVAEFAGAHPELGVRTYRTAAGLRVIVTGGDLPPGTPAAEKVLTELRSDPVYVLLCATHETYRARLTPKPWRVGWGAATVAWPYEPGEEARAERWTTQYADRCAGHATTRLLSVTGAEPTAKEAQVLAVHDGTTRATEALPLA